MKVKGFFDKPEEVVLRLGRYARHNNLAIRLITKSGEPWTTMTVNLDEKLPSNYAYVDVNNFAEAEEFIQTYSLGTYTGLYSRSGYVNYPLYKFDLEQLRKYEREDS